MIAVNKTATLWSRRLVQAARQRALAPVGDGAAPNCCWIICDVCCWVVC